MRTIILPICCCATLLGLQPAIAPAAYGTGGTSNNPALVFLDEARGIIAQNSGRFTLPQHGELLLAKLAILESQSDLKVALQRARSIKNPFYSSLALGGIAATEIPSDLSTSVKHFKEALSQSGNVKGWTGSHATSLSFLFELLPLYPEKQAHELLKVSQEAFYALEVSAYQKSQVLLALSKAVTAIEPERTKDLLYNVALKSNHYWDSIEHLATAMAQQSMKEALELSEKHYKAQTDWPNGQYFRRAVLIELAKTDFASAFEGIKKMCKLDQEIAAVKLAEFLLGKNRMKDAQQVIRHIESLKMDLNWTQSSLRALRSRLEQGEQVAEPSGAAMPEAIDDLLRDPSVARLQSISSLRGVVFRDKRQGRDFITVSLPLIEGFRDIDGPVHGAPRSRALGLLAVCSALIDEIPQALEISKRIESPEIRVSYLLEAYEATNPMTSTVAQWPIHLGQNKVATIMEEKNSPDMVIDCDKK